VLLSGINSEQQCPEQNTEKYRWLIHNLSVICCNHKFMNVIRTMFKTVSFTAHISSNDFGDFCSRTFKDACHLQCTENSVGEMHVKATSKCPQLVEMNNADSWHKRWAWEHIKKASRYQVQDRQRQAGLLRRPFWQRQHCSSDTQDHRSRQRVEYQHSVDSSRPPASTHGCCLDVLRTCQISTWDHLPLDQQSKHRRS